MTWTNEKPKAPGWYWYKTATGDEGDWAYEAQVILLRFDVGGSRSVYMTGSGVAYSLDDAHGQFAGPIPEPEEAKPASPLPSGLLFGDDVKIVAPEGFSVYPPPEETRSFASTRTAMSTMGRCALNADMAIALDASATDLARICPIP